MEFAYNNSHHNSIGMPPYQALYGRPCRTPLSWDRVEDHVLVGLELLQEMEEQVVQIRKRLKEAQDRQKSYADAHITNRSYEVGDRVFICIQLNKSTIWFGKGTKLSPRFIGPFEILERIKPVAYRLALPPHLYRTHNVFHVLVGPKLLQEMEEQVVEIRKRLKEAHDRQKSYADAHRTDRSYEVGDLYASDQIKVPFGLERGPSCHLAL